LVKSERLAVEAARAADSKKAKDVVIMDMRDSLGITDYFIIGSGNSDRQVKRICEAVRERLRGLGSRPARSEGEKSAHWIVLDYVDVVVHVFQDEERSFYDLEHLWQDVPFVEWREDGG
jgi:ribosome-associated protein